MQSKKVNLKSEHKIITNFFINRRHAIKLKIWLSISNTINQSLYFDIKYWQDFSIKLDKSYQTYYWVDVHRFYLICALL
jgi:hypothetical protein